MNFPLRFSMASKRQRARKRHDIEGENEGEDMEDFDEVCHIVS